MNNQAEFDFNAPPPQPSKASAEVLDRIKKLLRFGADERGTATEAEKALTKAYELCQRYHVDLAALDLDEDQVRIVHERFPIKQRLSFIEKRALNVLVAFFHVDVCVHRVSPIRVRLKLAKPEVTFVGRASDITIAHYVFEFVVRSGRRCEAEWAKGERAMRRKVTGNKRRNFMQGFIYGLTSRLSEARKSQPMDDSKTAIVVAERAERERYMDGLVGKTKPIQIEEGRRNDSAIMAGFGRGRDTTIAQPLNAAPGAPLALAAPR
jgi:hypothetical protein